jgi:alcohol dehydrogenase class IV
MLIQLKPTLGDYISGDSMTANINLPRILRVGAGAINDTAQSLLDLGVKSPLIITDAFIGSQSYSQKLRADLDAEGYRCGFFADCIPDPTTDSVQAALDALKAGDHDSVIGLGGGSSIDTAKAVAVMALRDGPMRDYKVPYVVNTGLPIIAIPTTAGTGSEVSRVSVITDVETQEKMLWMGIGLTPLAALVDYELSTSMPKRLTADTGLDSLCHALEAFVSKKSNPFTDSVALPAMKTIYENVQLACDYPDDNDAREAMMLAATQGGMAFANASVTLIHGMSRPIGAHFHVPHGMSNAMLLAEVTAWSKSAATERYADAARYIGIAEEDDNDQFASHKLVESLRELCKNLEVPTPKDYGIGQQQWLDALPLMAEQALASGSPNNNPRIPNAEEIIELYKKVWE